MWNKHQETEFATLEAIQGTDEYKAVVSKMAPEAHFLVDCSVGEMHQAISNFDTHQYECQCDQIGYKLHDGISFKIKHGYLTQCAYLKEHDEGRITKQSMLDNVYIKARCGQFSFAEIPKAYMHKDSVMLGVTGTLSQLSQDELSLIETEYCMHKKTYAPSMFGASNRRFAEAKDMWVEIDEQQYHLAVQMEIMTNLKQLSRAVLVFFETKEKLRDFMKSQHGRSLSDHVKHEGRPLRVLSEETDRNEKAAYIKKATAAGQVTLCTRIFGRGIDFVCHDDEVNANGGVHVLQTFFSGDVSEERQIMGRTARAGRQGTFSMVCLAQDLAKHEVTDEILLEWKRSNATFENLNQKRVLYQSQQHHRLLRDSAVLKDQHMKSVKFMQESDRAQATTFLESCNTVQVFGQETKSRVMCLLDGTGSMSSLIAATKKTIQETFKRATLILEENQVPSDCFEVQIVVYRNYNAPAELLLEVSPWERQPEELDVFIENVRATYGMGNEAIEVALAHANAQHQDKPISQVFIIGDAGPNSKDEVARKRNYNTRGEAYWGEHPRFATATDAETETIHLQQANVSIHSFYATKEATDQTPFAELSEKTGGTCHNLIVSDTNGSAELLTNAITRQILENVGGEKLVKAYDAKYDFSATYCGE